MVSLGIIAHAQGDHQLAIDYLQKALMLSHRIEDRSVTVLTLAALTGPLTSLNLPGLASRLLGAGLALQEASGTSFELIDEPMIEANIERVRAVLGEEQYFRCLAKGRELDLDTAIELALEGAES